MDVETELPVTPVIEATMDIDADPVSMPPKRKEILPPARRRSPPPLPSSNTGPIPRSKWPSTPPIRFTPNHRTAMPSRSIVPSPPWVPRPWRVPPWITRFRLPDHSCGDSGPSCSFQGPFDPIVVKHEDIEYDERSDGEVPSVNSDEENESAEDQDKDVEEGERKPYEWQQWKEYVMQKAILEAAAALYAPS